MLGYLATTNIESKDAVDASYAKYLEATKAVTPAELKTFLDKVTAEETDADRSARRGQHRPDGQLHAVHRRGRGPPDEGRPGLRRQGALHRRGRHASTKSAYTADNIGRLRTIQTSQTAGAIDALAAAYKYLDIQLNPLGLGSGPFKFVEYKTGESLEFDNNPDYFGGASEISKVFVPIIKDDIAGGQALAAGQVDWKYSIEGGTYAEIKDNPELKFVEYPDFGFFGLYFNLRDGPALRGQEPPSGGLVLLRQGGHGQGGHRRPGCRDLQRDPAGVVGLPDHRPEHVPDGCGQVEGAHRGLRLEARF